MSGYSISDALAHRDQPVPSPELPKRRRRRWLIVAVLVPVILAAGALVARQLFGEEDVYASPSTVELPTLPEDLTSVQEYLAGPEGAMVRGLIDAADLALAAGDGSSSCDAALAALDALGPPQQVFAAAEGVPDPDSAEMAVRHASALSRFLGACVSEDVALDTDELEFTTTILRRRLEGFE